MDASERELSEYNEEIAHILQSSDLILDGFIDTLAEDDENAENAPMQIDELDIIAWASAQVQPDAFVVEMGADDVEVDRFVRDPTGGRTRVVRLGPPRRASTRYRRSALVATVPPPPPRPCLRTFMRA